MAGCYRGAESVLQRMSEARKLATELQLQFTRAADAANLSVMADTDDASTEFAGQATERSQAVEKDAAALRPLLVGLMYSDEVRLLDEFDKRFAEDRRFAAPSTPKNLLFYLERGSSHHFLSSIPKPS